MSIYHWTILGLLIAAGIAANTYVIVYLTRPWRSTPAGRALMVKAWGNVILIDMALAAGVFGHNYPGRDLIRLIGLTLFAGGMWYLLIVLLRTPDDLPD
jgi:putative copper export protein